MGLGPSGRRSRPQPIFDIPVLRRHSGPAAFCLFHASRPRLRKVTPLPTNY